MALKEQILYLDPHDDFNSARDKMGWTQTARVLLVWPSQGSGLARRLDLLLLYRHASHLGAHLALISRDPQVRDHARDLGLPVFPSIEASRRARWRSRPPRPRFDRRQPSPDPDSLRPAPPRLRFSALPTWFIWVLRSLVFVIGLGAPGALAYTLIPAATITLTPAARPVSASVDIIADPDLKQVAGNLIPARAVRVEVETDGLTPTTGLRDVPSQPATGTVIFTNVAGTAVTLPEGVRVRTTGGVPVRFKTVETVTLDGRIGATVAVEVEAVDLGPAGNVAAGLINAIEGPLGLQLAVTNLAPTTGGAATQQPAVTSADRVRLRRQLLEQLQQEAAVEIENQLQPGQFVAADSIQLARIVEETFDLAVGEQADTVRLTLRIAVTGLVVTENDARLVAHSALAAQAPSGEALISGLEHYARQPDLTVDAEGRVHFTVTATGAAVPYVDQGAVREMVKGQDVPQSQQRLFDALPLAEIPPIDVRPAWFRRMPWLSFRIEVVVTDAREA